MALPPPVREAAIARIERSCRERVPEQLRAEMRLEQPLLAALEDDPTAVFWG